MARRRQRTPDGARFRGHVRRNRRGPAYWTACTVVARDRGGEFACTMAGPRGMILNTWRCQLEPCAGGTDVTESFGLPGTPLTRLYPMSAGSARGRTNLNGMRVTMERIKAAAEPAG